MSNKHNEEITGVQRMVSDRTICNLVTDVTEDMIVRSVLVGATDFALSADVIRAGYSEDVAHDLTWSVVLGSTEGAVISDAVLNHA